MEKFFSSLPIGYVFLLLLVFILLFLLLRKDQEKRKKITVRKTNSPNHVMLQLNGSEISRKKRTAIRHALGLIPGIKLAVGYKQTVNLEKDSDHLWKNILPEVEKVFLKFLSREIEFPKNGFDN